MDKLLLFFFITAIPGGFFLKLWLLLWLLDDRQSERDR